MSGKEGGVAGVFVGTQAYEWERTLCDYKVIH